MSKNTVILAALLSISGANACTSIEIPLPDLSDDNQQSTSKTQTQSNKVPVTPKNSSKHTPCLDQKALYASGKNFQNLSNELNSQTNENRISSPIFNGKNWKALEFSSDSEDF